MITRPRAKFVFDRKHSASDRKKGKIELRIIYNTQKKYISTGISVLPYQWDEVEYIVNSEEAMYLNDALRSLMNKVQKIINEMVEQGSIDLDSIPERLKLQSVDISFIEYLRERIAKKKVSDGTRKGYVTLLHKVEEFGRIQYFTDIKQNNLRAFSEWLHNYTYPAKDRFGNEIVKSYSQATIHKWVTRLSLFINDAVVDGYVQENPYITKHIKEQPGKTRIEEYLTKEEVRKIEKAAMPTPSVDDARNLFLLQCYTGLAYVDLMEYDFTALRDVKGMEVCSGLRHKTQQRFAFVTTKKTLALLKKYDYRIPKKPNQKYNYQLKIVADAAGIDKYLTTHMGRRTAGSIWLNDGIPIEVVSKCLGHSSVTMTQRAYAQILDNTILNAFQKLGVKKVRKKRGI